MLVRTGTVTTIGPTRLSIPAVLLLRLLSTSPKSTLSEPEKLETVKAHVALSNRCIVYRDGACGIKGIRFIMDV